VGSSNAFFPRSAQARLRLNISLYSISSVYLTGSQMGKKVQ
jgi:hypothetical protein